MTQPWIAMDLRYDPAVSLPTIIRERDVILLGKQQSVSPNFPHFV